jgi:hypothetical protein
MPSADAAQVRAVVAANRRTDDRRTVLAVHADPVWSGPDLLEGPEGLMRVEACRSPLAVRAALVGHEERNGELLVILTPCSSGELGLDVLARLVGRDVLTIDPFGAVRALFGATELDPEVAADRALIEDLIELAPSGGWLDRKPLNGILDADLAWHVWEQARLGLDHAPADLADLLVMARGPELEPALARLTPHRRAMLAKRWGKGAPEPVALIVDLLATGQRRDPVTLGFVAGALWAETRDDALAQLQAITRARFEPLLGRNRLNAVAAAAWEFSAGEALAHQANATATLDAAQTLLEQAGAAKLLVLSDRLGGGFDERLARFSAAVGRREVAQAAVALGDVRRHALADRRAPRIEMAQAALRLLRRSLQPAPAKPSTFAEAAALYASEGAWVDRALCTLAEGDDLPSVSSAYEALAAPVAEEAQATRSRFGALLAEWSQSEPMPDQRVVPVERVLAQVVAEVAAAGPVLVLVCDGMPLMVANHLLRDLLKEGWAPTSPADRDGWPVGVGVLPTVTEACRTSLLTGQRAIGGQVEEREGFRSHPALRAVSSPSKPPVLFHKASLTTSTGLALPEDVREALADRHQHVVGVVVNAVDDHLTRGDQIRVDWDMQSLRPLGWVLDAAAEAGRLVVLTSDHGHVLRRPGSHQRQSTSPGGERWRTTPPAASDGEVRVSGPRVLLGGGSVVLPVDEQLYYGVTKHGYHGGATPAEALVPLAVLARQAPDGWVHRPLSAPAWWETGGPAPSPLRTAREPLSPKKKPSRDQGALFEVDSAPPAVPRPAAAIWIDRLLASPAFTANPQRARLPRPIPDERIRQYLGVIDANGGSIPLQVLSLRTGEPGDSLRMALALVQRVLNLDGAEVLTVLTDGNVNLNRELLARQFEISL